MKIVEENIDEYSQNHSLRESDVLKDIRRKTYLETVYPRMLSGQPQAYFLGMLANIKKSKIILEIGTFTAYSAIAMAEMTDESTIIHTIENNVEFEDTINKNIENAGFTNRIILHIGDALQILENLNFVPDFVFIDADKQNYLNYFKMLLKIMKKDSFIVADNVLWSGKVLSNKIKYDKETLAIQDFNEFVNNDMRVVNLMLPIRDGLMLIHIK
ncbi:MAG: hypothetical protein AUJ98_02980 [Bacteroidetes bacterium CG2_30_33_31]|nr:MAG: hypothetical protein AUJ98_02980 [Bacteroidetes bacterium CG2_30_33_31]